jgi:choice-of-anchor A domain-containing protein/uncharacterized repeat protein (TIGR01451 family)
MRVLVAAVAVLLASTMAVAVAVGMQDRAVAQLPPDTDCMTDPLGPVPDANIDIVVRNDLDLKYTDSEGRMVVGRDATLEGFSVASELPLDPSRVDLAVGRDLTIFNSGINQGSATYGRTLTPDTFTPSRGTITQEQFSVVPYFTAMTIRSNSWASLTPVQGGVTGSDVVTFTGTDPVLNVFTVSAERLGAARTIRINVPIDAAPAQAPTTLINVTGGPYSAVGTSATEFWDGDSYEQIGHPNAPANLEALRVRTVWNFPDANDITLGGSMAWQGTILAPNAVARLSWQQVNGPIIVSYLYGNGETHLHRPVPCLPDPTPCPPQPPEPTPTPTPEPTPTPTPTPTPSPTPVPTPTPTPTPFPTPDPTPEPPEPPVPPDPIVTPTPTPDNTGPPDPLVPEGGVAGLSVDVRICKKVMTPGGRALEKVRRHAGGKARFRIRVTNLGTNPARRVRICDLLPRQFKLLKAPVKPFYVNGRPCMRIPLLTGQRQGFITVRISRTASGPVRNVAVVRSRASGRRHNSARVRVLEARQRGGGVTG